MASSRILAPVIAALAAGALLVFVMGREPTTSSLETDTARQTAIRAPSSEAQPAGAVAQPAGSVAGTRQRPAYTPAISPAEWKRRLQDSTDYFQFVSEAAVAALAGDGRAALLVSEILPKCQLLKLQYAKAADPKAAFEAHLATLPGRTPAGDELQRKDFNSCQRFLTDDPMKGLQPGAEGSTSKFWRELAEQNNDPLARSQHALMQSTPSASEVPAAFLDTIRSDLAVVIPSKDTDALFNAGLLLADARISKDPLRGVAWMIVAMENGYDGPAMKFPRCAETGACLQAADFNASLQRDIGAERYARVYAQAQEIKELMAREDWTALERYWMPDVQSR